MDEILQNLILSKNLTTLNKLKQSFVKEEQAFEKIKSKILLSKKVDLLDKILPELIHNKEVVLKINILFNNEKKVESVFDKSFDIHKKKLLKQIEFDTIYPNENQQRKDIEKFILTTNNFKLSTLVGNMKYYSKETLYQKKDLIRLNDWLKSIDLIYSVSEKNSYEYLEILSLKYKKTVQAIGTLTLDITNLSKQEIILEAKVQKVLKNNRNINQDIENLSRLLSSNFLDLISLSQIIISIIVIMLILFLSSKVTKNLDSTMDKIEEKVNDGLKEINALNNEIEDTQKEVIFTMGAIGESRSKETGNHVKRVAKYSYLLATYYGLTKDEADMLQQASPMHDIGKVGIPDSILNKPGRFDKDERKIMDTHAVLGYDMLKSSTRPLLKLAATVAYEHHEKWDGTGYPRGLKGKDIAISGRITALADVFDALGSNRCYKKAWSDKKIFKLFKEERGKHFDPKLIDIFFEHLDEFLTIRDKFKDI